MPLPFRDPSEMAPRERLDEFVRLLARGVVRLCRRLLATGEPLPARSADAPIPAPENIVFSPRK